MLTKIIANKETIKTTPIGHVVMSNAFEVIEESFDRVRIDLGTAMISVSVNDSGEAKIFYIPQFGKIHKHEFEYDTPIMVGRNRENDISIQDYYISGKHCVIEIRKKDDKHYITICNLSRVNKVTLDIENDDPNEVPIVIPAIETINVTDTFISIPTKELPINKILQRALRDIRKQEKQKTDDFTDIELEKYEMFIEKIKMIMLPNIPFFLEYRGETLTNSKLDPKEMYNFFKSHISINDKLYSIASLFIDMDLYSDSQSDGHMFYSARKGLREVYGDQYIARYLAQIYLLFNGTSTDKKNAFAELSTHYKKFIKMTVGRLKLLDMNKNELFDVNRHEPHSIDMLRPQDITINHSSFCKKNRYFLTIKHKEETYFLYRSNSHNRWKRQEVVQIDNLSSSKSMHYSKHRIEWFAKPDTESYNDLHPILSKYIDEAVGIDSKTGKMKDDKQVKKLKRSRELIPVYADHNMLCDGYGVIYRLDENGNLTKTNLRVDPNRYQAQPYSFPYEQVLEFEEDKNKPELEPEDIIEQESLWDKINNIYDRLMAILGWS